MVLQEISFLQVMTALGVIVAIISQIFGIANMNKRNREKFATKEFVKQENKNMDTKIINLEKDLTEHQKINLREHDKMQATFDNIDKKLDRIFDLIRKTG